MKSSIRVAAAAAITLSLASCATRPDKIEASYVSPLAYQDYSCEQLVQEAQRVSSRASEVTGAQRKKAQGDAVAMGVALVVFWPALFFIKGNGATESEVARLKGEMNAIEEVSVQKNCGIQFQKES